MQGEIAYRSHMVSFKKSFLLMGKLFCSTVFAQILDRRQKKWKTSIVRNAEQN